MALFEERTAKRWIHLAAMPLDTGLADRFLRGERAGGITLFVGTTRRFTDGRETVRLTYEAYAPMAGAELQRLADTAADRWPIQKLVLHHRTGEVPVAEASVIVGVACAHRDAAFASARWLIDTLKARVPIWKRETFADGATAWVEGQLPPPDRPGD